MSNKRRKLDLTAAAVPRPDPVDTAVAQHQATAAAPPLAVAEEPKEAPAPVPVHTKRINVPITADDYKSFNLLKVETGKRGPELITEALDLLFAKYAKD